MRDSVLLILLFLFVFAAPAYSQTSDIFETKRLTIDIKHRFNLSNRDLHTLEPLIDQENRKVIKIYARFSGEEPEYSPRVWGLLVADRLTFEATISFRLTPRQREALRSARSKMEKRMLEYLVYDYVGFLAQVLELSEPGFNDVSGLFAAEVEKKRRIVAMHISNPPLLQKEIDKITIETELRLRKILTPEQWRYYLELSQTFQLIA